MGLNLDISSMLGVPTEVSCPKCKREAYAYFDDLDVESFSVNPKPGVLELTCPCDCGYEITVKAIFRHKLQVT